MRCVKPPKIWFWEKEKEGLKPSFFRCAFYCCSNASRSAFAIWSGQEVLLLPQVSPSIRWMASWAGIPFSKEEIPFRFPLHPPKTCLLYTSRCV